LYSFQPITKLNWYKNKASNTNSS